MGLSAQFGITCPIEMRRILGHSLSQEKPQRGMTAFTYPLLPVQATISASLNAAAMMIGEKGSDLVLGKPAMEPIIVPD